MRLSSPNSLNALLARVRPVLPTEVLPISALAGRVSAEPLGTDRDSPACDVSAVDGYAVRLADITTLSSLPVAFQVPAGVPSPELPIGACARVFTGAPVPAGADLMIPREHVDESHPKAIAWSPAALDKFKAGANIRRQGENIRANELVAALGREIDPSFLACLSSFGCPLFRVHRKIRVHVLVTGDEVLDAMSKVQPWQVRDANGPALEGLLSTLPWVESVKIRHIKDDPEILRQATLEAVKTADALLLTGGVSAGDLDFVPRVLAEAGCDIVFHKLSIRPGKPLLGAVTQDGKPVFGLPGNPVAVMTCARRFALPALRMRAGFAEAMPGGVCVEVVGADAKTLDLTWFRPVKLIGNGKAQLVPSQGSGDPAGAARGDGFVEVAPGKTCAGWLPFFPW